MFLIVFYEIALLFGLGLNGVDCLFELFRLVLSCFVWFNVCFRWCYGFALVCLLFICGLLFADLLLVVFGLCFLI